LEVHFYCLSHFPFSALPQLVSLQVWGGTDRPKKITTTVAFFEFPVFMRVFVGVLSLFCRFFCRFFVAF
jgi:hypothetical protein